VCNPCSSYCHAELTEIQTIITRADEALDQLQGELEVLLEDLDIDGGDVEQAVRQGSHIFSNSGGLSLSVWFDQGWGKRQARTGNFWSCLDLFS